MKKKLRVAVQMDRLERLNKSSDSTLYLARHAAKLGHELFHYVPQNLWMETSGKSVRVKARGHALSFKTAAQDSAALGKASVQDIFGFDVVLMRQDPPFDLAYIAATHILEHLKGNVRVVNDPAGVRNAPEKLLATHFPQLMPPTIVARDTAAIEKFRAVQGEVVFKPLYGWAGYGIFHLRRDDNNLHALLETMSRLNEEPWMVQKYLPEIRTAGDKRIVLLDGDPVGVFRRMPAKDDARGNMRVGAKPERAPLTKRDKEICAALKPELCKRGLFLAGIDVIGDYLTEINVTSPTGLAVADQLEGRSGDKSIAAQFWARL